jgi:beta-barrel assembly-enhancing protease
MKPISLFGACLLAGCTVGGPLEEVQEAVAGVVLPPEQAEQLGSRMAAEVEAKQGLHPDEALQQRVSRIGQRLAAEADAPEGIDFEFSVVQDERVNAFALPGGHIYVTSGLMETAGSEAELASVIAHEVAHVTERHIAERMATSYGVQALAGAALGQSPGTVTQLVSSLLQQGAIMKYSRSQELQADRVGVGTLEDAGYDPQAAIAMFRKLEKAGGDGAPAFLSSHPGTGERIEQLQDIIAER